MFFCFNANKIDLFLNWLIFYFNFCKILLFLSKEKEKTEIVNNDEIEGEKR